jgi:hypothetical protein
MANGDALMPDDLGDLRRWLLITIDWSAGAGIGRISFGTEYWAAVEWSERRQAWRIEDAEGRCLTYAASILGQAASKEAVEALAREMIRDGRMPSPQQAHTDYLAREAAGEAKRKRRREKYNQQPAVIRRREEARARQDRTRLGDRRGAERRPCPPDGPRLGAQHSRPVHCRRRGVFLQADAVRGRKIPVPELDGRQWRESPGDRVLPQAVH